MNIEHWKNKKVAFLGDSTFFHSGIPPLISAKFNNHKITMVILDNRITAMTGQQPNPGTGRRNPSTSRV